MTSSAHILGTESDLTG